MNGLVPVPGTAKPPSDEVAKTERLGRYGKGYLGKSGRGVRGRAGKVASGEANKSLAAAPPIRIFRPACLRVCGDVLG